MMGAQHVPLDRVRREKDEGRDEKGWGMSRTKETRKWMKGRDPSGEVEGNKTHIHIL
jgi:hypothetical protein